MPHHTTKESAYSFQQRSGTPSSEAVIPLPLDRMLDVVSFAAMVCVHREPSRELLLTSLFLAALVGPASLGDHPV